MVDVKQIDHEAIATILDAGGFTLTGSDMRQPDSPRTPVEMAALMALATQREAYEARIAELERERDNWREQFDSAAAAASEYSEFWELHRGDFDSAGNYIPHSQIDGDLRAAESRLASYDALVEALCYCRAALDSEIASLLDSVCLKDETGTPIRATAEEGCLPDLERMEHASRAAADALKKVGR